MNYYVDAFHRYAQFSGRADVREYWMFVLWNAIFVVSARYVGGAIGFAGLEFIYNMVVLVPGLAITARRLHDTGRSGWLQLLWFIPVIGWIVLIVFLCEGTKAPNRKS